MKIKLKINSQFLPSLPLSFEDNEADEDDESDEVEIVEIVSSKFKWKEQWLLNKSVILLNH